MRLTATPPRRALLLIGIVLVLEVLVFRSYFFGSAIPPWDFLGSYNTDAYLWWTEGGFFTPVDWIPNLWAGYPSALNIQNSAWYLPVGIASLFGSLTLHSAAVLAALHVALGVVGTYRLTRSLDNSFAVSLVVSVAGFFAVGYFSNAEHVDITRGYALIPWVLLVLSPSWPWRRWWGMPLAAFVIWQAVTGIYPGMIVTTVYVGVVWVVVHQIRSRPALTRYLLPLAVAGVIAVLLSLPRLLPYFLTQQAGATVLPDSSEFSLALIGTLQFGYGSGELPNDISMRSFFIPATMLVLAVFARLSDASTRQALAIGVPAAVLGLPFLPWFDAVQLLPGLALSRFTMSDFKVFLILAVLLLSSSGLSSLQAIAEKQNVTRALVVRMVLGAVLIFLLAVIGAVGPYTKADWLPAVIALGASLTGIIAFVLIRTRGTKLPWNVQPSTVLVSGLVILTAASGGYWAFTTQAPWRTDRIIAETQAYGSTVDELISEHVDYSGETQRPARIPPPAGYDLATLFDVRGNRVYYTGEYALGGYLNFKGSLTPEELQAALLDESTGTEFADFITAPGLVLFDDDGESLTGEQLESCAADSDCGDGTATADGYSPGHLSYEIRAPRPTEAVLNEAYYAGWEATACDGAECRALDVQRNDDGLVQITLPAGDYKLNVDYRTPGRSAGWIAFGLGILLALAAALITVRARRSLGTKAEVTS